MSLLSFWKKESVSLTQLTVLKFINVNVDLEKIKKNKKIQCEKEQKEEEKREVQDRHKISNLSLMTEEQLQYNSVVGRVKRRRRSNERIWI